MEERTSKIAIEYLEHYKKVKYGMLPEWVQNMAIKALEQEPILDKIRAEITKYEGDCRLSVAEYPSCKQCTDNAFETIYGIIDKYKEESGEQTHEQ